MLCNLGDEQSTSVMATKYLFTYLSEQLLTGETLTAQSYPHHTIAGTTEHADSGQASWSPLGFLGPTTSNTGGESPRKGTGHTGKERIGPWYKSLLPGSIPFPWTISAFPLPTPNCSPLFPQYAPTYDGTVPATVVPNVPEAAQCSCQCQSLICWEIYMPLKTVHRIEPKDAVLCTLTLESVPLNRAVSNVASMQL